MNCKLCSKILVDRPKIKIEDKIYCFRCAKKVVYKIQKENANKAWIIFSEEKEKYRLSKEKFDKEHSDWLRRNTKFVTSGFLSSFVFAGILSIGLSIIMYYMYEKIVWIGIVLGFYLWFKISAYDINKKDKEFTITNPEPKFVDNEPEYNPIQAKHQLVIDKKQDTNKKYSRVNILVRDDFICQNCGRYKPKDELEVHHIMPRSNGGIDHQSNLISLCKYCHDRENWYGHIRAYPTTFKNESI